MVLRPVGMSFEGLDVGGSAPLHLPLVRIFLLYPDSGFLERVFGYLHEACRIRMSIFNEAMCVTFQYLVLGTGDEAEERWTGSG